MAEDGRQTTFALKKNDQRSGACYVTPNSINIGEIAIQGNWQSFFMFSSFEQMDPLPYFSISPVDGLFLQALPSFLVDELGAMFTTQKGSNRESSFEDISTDFVQSSSLSIHG